VTTAATRLAAPEFRAGFVLLLPVAAYLLSHQFVHRHSRWRVPKELCVAVLLGGGVAVFTASRPGADLRALCIPLTLFVLLCFSNCALISLWENAVDLSHGQTSLALQSGRAAAYYRWVPWVISAVAAAACLECAQGTRPAVACAAASAVLLGLVDLMETRIGRVRARVLADVALMTPALHILLQHLR
jgi:uncharacterized membrane protein